MLGAKRVVTGAKGRRHYVVGFDIPKARVIIMSNSSNGEDTYDGLLRAIFADTFTSFEW